MKSNFKTDKVIMDVYHCFGLTFNENLDIKEEEFVKLKWKSFLKRNKRQKLGGSWYLDEWLLKKARQCMKTLGYTFRDDVDEVLMSKKETFPLIIRVNPIRQPRKFSMLIAPLDPQVDDIYERPNRT